MNAHVGNLQILHSITSKIFKDHKSQSKKSTMQSHDLNIFKPKTKKNSKPTGRSHLGSEMIWESRQHQLSMSSLQAYTWVRSPDETPDTCPIEIKLPKSAHENPANLHGKP